MTHCVSPLQYSDGYYFSTLVDSLALTVTPKVAVVPTPLGYVYVYIGLPARLKWGVLTANSQGNVITVCLIAVITDT